LGHLDTILEKGKTGTFDYPPKTHGYFIELMKKFELCLSLDENRILIPDLLKKEEPEFEFNYDDSLKFIIDYDFLPRSIMPRFIVNMHRDIKDDLQWRTGVVLKDEAFHSTAVIKSDERDRKIFIYVTGDQKRDYFSIIRKTLRDINESFEKLDVTELVPLPDNDDITVEYEELIGHERAGKSEIFIGKLGKGYNVGQLLDGIEKPGDRVRVKAERPIVVKPEFEVIVPEKKKKWYETVWGIIVGIGVLVGIIGGIIAILKG
ncbi:MAG: hypothetical protein GY940_17300, partial [bacterium]|nr:hypothetical protein [bacterium]